MDLGLRGRAALVTASSEGMGLATALVLAAEGADVALCARRAQPLAAARAAVAAHGVRTVATVADVADSAQVEAMVAASAAGLGRLDILVVNAGGPPPGSFSVLDDAAWQAAHELTLMSAVRLIRAALPVLHGSDQATIVLVGSYGVKDPIPGLILSNSVRLAVVGLAKTLARELAPAVRVNTLLPGSIATARHAALVHRQAEAAGVDDAEQVRRSDAEIPLGRPGTPEEFARVAAFVASPAAGYVTGQVIAVDGGRIHCPL